MIGAASGPPELSTQRRTERRVATAGRDGRLNAGALIEASTLSGEALGAYPRSLEMNWRKRSEVEPEKSSCGGPSASTSP
jgi:hypothetical protein